MDAVGHDARESIAVPGTVLGFGFGGFLDGIVLHQLLQWHHMLSSTNSDNIGIRYYPADTVSGLRVNTVWDGVFHAGTWLALLVGLWLLYSRVTRSHGRFRASRTLCGWILIGWGLFNLIEGIIDHHILAIHHVRSGPGQTWWDIGFLVLGAVLVLAGWALQRTGRPLDGCAPGPRPPSPSP